MKYIIFETEGSILIKKFFNRFTVYDIIFLYAVTAVFIYSVFIPPVHSIADQGDFERIMRPCGLDFTDNHSFYDFAIRYFKSAFTYTNKLLYIPRLIFLIPSTTFILPVTIAKMLCFNTLFDMRILAVIMFSWYSIVCMLILRRIKIQSPAARLIFMAFFITVFFNGVNLTFFNSLYGQSVMLASFATVILAALHLFDTPSDKAIIFFTIASCLLIGSKLQCFVFTPFLAAGTIYAGRKKCRRILTVICAAVILFHGIGGYIINGFTLNTATQYNSVFYGILKDSPNPGGDLTELGIDESMAADSGKHAFLDPSEYKYPPAGAEAEEKFHSKMSNIKLIKFYITHPNRFIKAMEETAQNSFYNKINLGTFEEKYGFEQGYSEYRFDLWENIRSSFPHTLYFIIPVLLGFIIIAIFMIKRRSVYGIPFLAVIIMGAIQFPMPYIGNGAADISKQLFLFNIVFDLCIMVIFYMIIRKIEIFFQKKS